MCDEHPRGILAQVVEHLTFNQVVPGSSPGCLIRSMICKIIMRRELRLSPFMLVTVSKFISHDLLVCLWETEFMTDQNGV